MKNRINILIGFLIILSSFFIVLGFIKISSNLDDSYLKEDESSKKIASSKTVDELRNELIKDKTIINELDISSRYKSIVLSNESNEIESYIIDKKNVSVGDFTKLIDNNKQEDFWNKVYELLSLKYPTFIVDGIKTTTGNIVYDVYDNQVIIYFYNYQYDPEYTDTVSIKVNYNEIYSYLNFAYKLDDEYENEDGTNYDPSKKTIAFTFDDGPSDKTTKDVVDALVNNKSKATFFMVGSNMNNYKDVVKYVYDNNMEIGSHTYNHINLTKSSYATITTDLKKVNDTYKSIVGEDIKLLRPPYGAKNKEILNKIDYPFIIWNVDTNDWRYKDKDRIVNHILENACDGCIVLMHDVYGTTRDAVIKVLPKLYAMGYQVVNVSTLAELKGKTIDSHNVYGYIK